MNTKAIQKHTLPSEFLYAEVQWEMLDAISSNITDPESFILNYRGTLQGVRDLDDDGEIIDSVELGTILVTKFLLTNALNLNMPSFEIFDSLSQDSHELYPFGDANNFIEFFGMMDLLYIDRIFVNELFRGNKLSQILIASAIFTFGSEASHTAIIPNPDDDEKAADWKNYVRSLGFTHLSKLINPENQSEYSDSSVYALNNEQTSTWSFVRNNLS